MRQPSAIKFAIYRRIRNLLLWLNPKTRGHFEFYSNVVDDTALTDPDRAIGSFDKVHWNNVGKMQFEYLLQQKMEPCNKFLDIGCGNLRAGIHIINYLDQGNYFGTDISKNVLLSANENIAAYGLEGKLPHIYITQGANLNFLPKEYFDIIHAHSVFSHLDTPSFIALLKACHSLLKADGYFDLTFKEGRVGGYMKEDFYYTKQNVVDICSVSGYSVTFPEDWTYSQVKARLKKYVK